MGNETVGNYRKCIFQFAWNGKQRISLLAQINKCNAEMEPIEKKRCLRSVCYSNRQTEIRVHSIYLGRFFPTHRCTYVNMRTNNLPPLFIFAAAILLLSTSFNRNHYSPQTDGMIVVIIITTPTPCRPIIIFL